MSTTARPSLIRVKLVKPMGIVFEPVPDAKRGSKYPTTDSIADVGAQIKSMTPDGAAAVTGKLKVGDQLVSIDDEFTTDVLFDDIMDMFVKSKRSLSLLFRAPPEEPKKKLFITETGWVNTKTFTLSSLSIEETERRSDEKTDTAVRCDTSTDEKRHVDRVVSPETTRDTRNNRPDQNFERGLIEIFFDSICSPCGVKDDPIYPAESLQKNDEYVHLRGTTLIFFVLHTFFPV